MNLTSENTAIVLDSTSDYPDAPARFPNMRFVPLYVRFGDETYRDYVELGPAAFYEKLRGNIRALSPSLDEWMIVEGYGKVLSREGLDLGRRELCIVAACAAAGQDRQLHSHLHGALNAGVPADVVRAALECLVGVVNEEMLARARLLFERVVGKG